MSQALTVYQSPDAVVALRSVGEAIAKSGIVRGCETVEMGMMFAMTAAGRNVDPMALAQKYEILQGRLSMPAKVMLSEFALRGGEHRVIERTPEAAEIRLIYKGKDQTFRLTWEDAQQETFVYSGKEAETLRMIAAKNTKLLAERMKPKYATPRSRMQMLWARVVSDGVGVICPEVTTGVYTPEEIEDFSDEPSARLPASVSSDQIALPPPAAAGLVIEAELEVKPELAAGPQIARMTELFGLLGIDPAGQMKAFASVGSRDMGDVTTEGADAIIAKMQARLDLLAPSPPAIPESAAKADDGSPVSAEQVAVIKQLIESVSQREGMAGVPGRIKEHLNRHGVAKITHLTSLSAQSLIDSLNGTAGLEDFFDVPPRSTASGK